MRQARSAATDCQKMLACYCMRHKLTADHDCSAVHSILQVLQSVLTTQNMSRRYLGVSRVDDIAYTMIEVGMRSVAKTTIITMQVRHCTPHRTFNCQLLPCGLMC